MKKILVIDYDQALLASLHKILTDEGYAIVLAADGKSGWEKYEQEEPDLVLMEAMLSKIHGFELCEKITREGRGKTPVFMMTGVYRDRVYRTEALRTYGASLYLEKPLNMPELLSSIEAAIGPGDLHPDREEVVETETPPQTGPVNGKNRTLEAAEVLVQTAIPLKGTPAVPEPAKDAAVKPQPRVSPVPGPVAPEARAGKPSAPSKESPKEDAARARQAKPAGAAARTETNDSGSGRPPAHEPAGRRSSPEGAGLREVEAPKATSPAPMLVKPPVPPIRVPRVVPIPDPIEKKAKDILAEAGFNFDKEDPSRKKEDTGSEDIDKLLKSTLADFNLGAEKKRPVEKAKKTVLPPPPSPVPPQAPPKPRTAEPVAKAAAQPAAAPASAAGTPPVAAPIETPAASKGGSPFKAIPPAPAGKPDLPKAVDGPAGPVPLETSRPPVKVPPQQIKRTAPEPPQAKTELKPVAPSKPATAPAAVETPRPAAVEVAKAVEPSLPPVAPAARVSPGVPVPPAAAHPAFEHAPKAAADAPASAGKRPTPPGAGPTVTVVGLEEKDMAPVKPLEAMPPASEIRPVPEAAPKKREPGPEAGEKPDPVAPKPPNKEPGSGAGEHEKTSEPGTGSRIFRDIYEPEKKKSSPVFLGIGIAIVAVAAVAFLILRPKPASSRLGADMASTPGQTDVTQAPVEDPAPVKPEPKPESPKPKAGADAAAKAAAQDAVLLPQIGEAPRLGASGTGTKPPAVKAAEAKIDAAAPAENKQPETKPAETAAGTTPPQGAGQTAAGQTTENPAGEAAGQPAAQPAVAGPAAAPKAKPGELVDINTVDVQPKVVKSVSPLYPPQALRYGKEGVVTVNALIDDVGNVIDTGIIKGLQDDMGMEKAAQAAVKRWKFQPAVKDGVKVRVWKAVIVSFKRGGNTATANE